MRGNTIRAASIGAALLGTSGLLVACGDDNPPATDGGIDGGSITADAGQDGGGETGDADVDGGGGGEDAGSDAGPPPSHLRLAHLIPGAPDVHVCLYVPASATSGLLITRDPETSAPTAIPYKGVSGYADIALPPIDVRVKVFDAGDVTGDACPESGEIIDQVIPGAGVIPGAYYTVAATGLPTGTGEAEPELVLFEDDLAAPTTAGDTRVRLLNAVPDFPVTVTAVDVCYDPDVEGSEPTVEILDNVAFEAVSDYLERAPITTGQLQLHAHNPAGVGDCLAATQLAVIPVPIPVPTGSPPNYVTTFVGDETHTIFLVGSAAAAAGTDEAVTILPVWDTIGM